MSFETQLDENFALRLMKIPGAIVLRTWVIDRGGA
jgi:hypothetical protein